MGGKEDRDWEKKREYHGNSTNVMNTLITILVFSFILLVAVIIAFLAGLHAAKLGVQEIIRDTLIKSKKEEEYGYDGTDSDYEEEEEEQPYRSVSSYRRRSVSPPHKQQQRGFGVPHRRITEEHYTLQGDNPPPYHLYASHTPASPSLPPPPPPAVTQHFYPGDGSYLARI